MVINHELLIREDEEMSLLKLSSFSLCGLGRCFVLLFGTRLGLTA